MAEIYNLNAAKARFPSETRLCATNYPDTTTPPKPVSSLACWTGSRMNMPQQLGLASEAPALVPKAQIMSQSC